MTQRWKSLLRLWEARWTPRRAQIIHDGRRLRFTRSLFWDDTSQRLFDSEIAPYFLAIDGRHSLRVAVDAGAASGQFAVAACAAYPQLVIHAFEPSSRQRTLLRRNVQRNGCERRVVIHDEGLWDCEGFLAFRTHGAIGSFQAATSLPKTLAFDEKARVNTLDAWAAAAQPSSVDLVKMDVEGAELEALRGARQVLSRYCPALLVQAYHQRDGERTFERCVGLLAALGYECREMDPPSGFLVALPTL